ncbi:hypothetical protein GC209_11905 [bacterium]|nr:hypothetical protein [bacterium]
MTRHQLETELSDIRREITRLQRREAQLLTNPQDADQPLPRAGWPMRRATAVFVPQAQASGAMSSTSAPSRIAV